MADYNPELIESIESYFSNPNTNVGMKKIYTTVGKANKHEHKVFAMMVKAVCEDFKSIQEIQDYAWKEKEEKNFIEFIFYFFGMILVVPVLFMLIGRICLMTSFDANTWMIEAPDLLTCMMSRTIIREYQESEAVLSQVS